MKTLSLILMTALAALLLAGCSGGDKAAPIEGEIKTAPNAGKGATSQPRDAQRSLD